MTIEDLFAIAVFAANAEGEQPIELPEYFPIPDTYLADDEPDAGFADLTLNDDDEPMGLPMYDFGDRPATSQGGPTDFNRPTDFDWHGAFVEKSNFGTAQHPAGESLDRDCC